MVRINYGRLATGIVFLALFLGFELHIPAIQSLIPGSYAGLTTGNYLGFGFLLAALGALGAAFSTTPSYAGPPAGSRSGTAGADPYTLAAAMMAMQQAQQMQAHGSVSASVSCPSCGKPNQAGAKFCQQCAAPIPGTGPAGSPTGTGVDQGG